MADSLEQRWQQQDFTEFVPSASMHMTPASMAPSAATSMSATSSTSKSSSGGSRFRLVECGPLNGVGAASGRAASTHLQWARAPAGGWVRVRSSTAFLPNRESDKQRVENSLGLPEFGDYETQFYAVKSGLVPIAVGYDRIVYGDHGPYVELSDCHIYWQSFPNYVERPSSCFFDECWTADGLTMLYAQKRPVTNKPNPPCGPNSVTNNRPEGYANYLSGKYYLACEPEVIAVMRFNTGQRRRRRGGRAKDEGKGDGKGEGKGDNSDARQGEWEGKSTDNSGGADAESVADEVRSGERDVEDEGERSDKDAGLAPTCGKDGRIRLSVEEVHEVDCYGNDDDEWEEYGEDDSWYGGSSSSWRRTWESSDWWSSESWWHKSGARWRGEAWSKSGWFPKKRESAADAATTLDGGSASSTAGVDSSGQDVGDAHCPPASATEDQRYTGVGNEEVATSLAVVSEESSVCKAQKDLDDQWPSLPPPGRPPGAARRLLGAAAKQQQADDGPSSNVDAEVPPSVSEQRSNATEGGA